jgi:hypothetical protein
VDGRFPPPSSRSAPPPPGFLPDNCCCSYGLWIKGNAPKARFAIDRVRGLCISTGTRRDQA